MPLYRGGYRTVDPTGIGTGSVDATELNYLDGATSNLQSQLDNHVQAVTKGGTNLTSYALGDLIYASATNTLAKLSGNTSVTKQFLSQTGNGTISAAPAWSALSAGDIPAGIDATKIGSGTMATARLGSGTADSARFLRGDSSWSDTLGALILGNSTTITNSSNQLVGTSGGPRINAASGLQPGFSINGAQRLLIDGAGDTMRLDLSSFYFANALGSISTVINGICRTSGADVGTWLCAPSGGQSGLAVAGSKLVNTGGSFGVVGATRWAVGQYAVGTAVATQPGIGSDGTNVTHNVPTGGVHELRVNNAVVGLFQSSLITFSAPIALGNAYTVTPGLNQIVGTANGVQINAPMGSTVALSTNGTTRASLGFNGLVFAAGATPAAPGNISIGSNAGNTMSLNVPSGGLYLFGENGTSGVAISAASQYLQFQGQGGILGAAGNAGHCYIAGGNVAANSSCAYIRVYGVSDSSNAGQAVYACGDVAGAKHSFVDGSGTERLTIDETAVTALGPLVTPAATPASATAAGVAGQWAWDANFIYICVAANTWRRVAHATW